MEFHSKCHSSFMTYKELVVAPSGPGPTTFSSVSRDFETKILTPHKVFKVNVSPFISHLFSPQYITPIANDSTTSQHQTTSTDSSTDTVHLFQPPSPSTTISFQPPSSLNQLLSQLPHLHIPLSSPLCTTGPNQINCNPFTCRLSWVRLQQTVEFSR